MCKSQPAYSLAVTKTCIQIGIKIIIFILGLGGLLKSNFLLSILFPCSDLGLNAIGAANSTSAMNAEMFLN